MWDVVNSSSQATYSYLDLFPYDWRSVGSVVVICFAGCCVAGFCLQLDVAQVVAIFSPSVDSLAVCEMISVIDD